MNIPTLLDIIVPVTFSNVVPAIPPDEFMKIAFTFENFLLSFLQYFRIVARRVALFT